MLVKLFITLFAFSPNVPEGQATQNSMETCDELSVTKCRGTDCLVSETAPPHWICKEGNYNRDSGYLIYDQYYYGEDCKVECLAFPDTQGSTTDSATEVSFFSLRRCAMNLNRGTTASEDNSDIAMEAPSA